MGVNICIERTLQCHADRNAYWAQVADPSAWKPTHPVLQSANVRMVEYLNGEGTSGTENVDSNATNSEGGSSSVSARQAAKVSKPIDLGPFKLGRGLVLRHKEGTGFAGDVFCTRECIELDMPKEGSWRIMMRTTDIGVGYPFLPNTEESVVAMLPAEKDGSIQCILTINAFCSSRFFRWWYGLKKNSIDGAELLLDGIAEEVGRSKKKD